MGKLIIACLAAGILIVGLILGLIFSTNPPSTEVRTFDDMTVKKDMTEERIFHGTLYGLTKRMSADIYSAADNAFKTAWIESEKEWFMPTMADFDVSAALFQNATSQYEDEEAEKTTALFGKVVALKAEMIESANAMFDAEATGGNVTSAARAFEQDVDAISDALAALEDMHRQRFEEAAAVTPHPGVNHGQHYRLVNHMEADIFEGIEEAVSYPLLGDESEKQDFMTKMQDFDESAKLYESAALQYDNDAEEERLFAKTVAAKAELVQAVEKMFAAFEEDSEDLTSHIETVEAHTEKVRDAIEALEAIEWQQLQDEIAARS